MIISNNVKTVNDKLMTRRNIYLIFTSLILMSSGCNDDNPTSPGGSPDIIKYVFFYDKPAWHPDGKWIAVEHVDSIDADFDGIVDTRFSGIWIVNAETGYKQPLIRGFGSPAWSRDGKRLAMHGGAQIFSVEVSSLEPAQIDSSSILQLTSEGANFFPAWSPDGDWIAYDSNIDDTKYDIWIVRSDGSSKRNISGESDSTEQGGWRIPNWSSDGRWIAHQRYISGGESGTEIYIMDTSGTNAIWLEHGSGPKFSPDGREIAINSKPRNGSTAVWIMKSDGSNLRRLTKGSGSDFRFDWSPDGKQIVFLRWNSNEPIEGNGQLWVINTDGTNLRQLTFN